MISTGTRAKLPLAISFAMAGMGTVDVSGASASTLKVPGDFSTIQLAVDAADPGDTVEISKKENFENVIVFEDDITVKAKKGKDVIVDGFLEPGGTGFQFLASGAENFKLKDLKIRNGDGVECNALSTGCSVIGVEFAGENTDDCFDSDAGGATLKNSDIRSCGDRAAEINGDDAVVKNNTFKFADDGCIDITGNDAVVSNNVIQGCDDADGIHVVGDGAVIENNEMNRVEGMVDVAGEKPTVTGNTGGKTSTSCFDVTGLKAKVKDNSCTLSEEYGIYVGDADEAVVSGNTTEQTGGAAIFISSSNEAEVSDNQVTDINGEGVYLFMSDDAEVADNTVKRTDGEGIRSSSSLQAEIAGNTLQYIIDDGIALVSADDSTVKQNKITNADGDAIDVSSSANSLIRANKAELIGGRGIDADGMNPVVTKNTVQTVSSDGIYVTCTASCDDYEVSDNVVTDTGDGEYGIHASVPAATGSGEVSDNVVKRATDHAFNLSISNGVIEGNVARDSGSQQEAGFNVIGDLNVVSLNSSIGNGGDGFLIDGDDNLVTENSADKNHGDGFQVASAETDNTLTKNVATDNEADGIENDGTDTILKKNDASGNRRDCANDGTIAVQLNNECADGSDFALPGTASRKHR